MVANGAPTQPERDTMHFTSVVDIYLIPELIDKDWDIQLLKMQRDNVS